MELNQIIQGDCVQVMKTFPDNFFDSVVTDPPYNLTFMGQKWDGTGIAYDVNLWKEVLRVLKPGGHLLSFGATRTFHRMVCAIEDAGFEIRDAICWIHGQGFPKSLNIGKAVDKSQGNEREVIGDNPNVRPNCNPEDNSLYKYGSIGKTAPITKGNSEWEGWGTALKPAFEFICVARKHLSEKNIALNVLKWRTGGINIDGCRIGIDKDDHIMKYPYSEGKYKSKYNGGSSYKFSDIVSANPQGRFPANVILECICDEGKSYQVEGFIKNNKPQAPSNYNDAKGGQIHTNPECPCYMLDEQIGIQASRFFYIAKASRKEREIGLEKFEKKRIKGRDEGQDARDVPYKLNPAPMRNQHPTVKPLKLMENLVKLVTPPNGIVLDPFVGSGTTCMACKKLGFKYIGIEKEEEYVAIARSRIKAIQEDTRLF